MATTLFTKTIIFLCILIPYPKLFAQKNICGKIVDEDLVPISLTHIYPIENKNNGTVSNPSGEFQLQYEDLNQKICISHLSYEPCTITIGELLEKQLIVLKKQVINLAEVVVLPHTAKDIISTAFSNISQNYPKEYTMASGYLRKQIVCNDKYFFFGECNMDLSLSSILKISQTNKWGFKANYSQLKVSEDKLFDNRAFLTFNMERLLWMYPFFSFIHPLRVDLYKWEITNITKAEEEVLEIKFTPINFNQNSPESGYVYINNKNKAIMAVKYSYPSESFTVSATAGSGNIHCSAGTINIYVYFTPKNGVYSLSYARADIVNKITISSKKNNINLKEVPLSMSYDYLVQEYGNKDVSLNKLNDPFTSLKKIDSHPFSQFKPITPDLIKLF